MGVDHVQDATAHWHQTVNHERVQLTLEEEIDLGYRVQQGDHQARERLIKSGLGLVASMARKQSEYGVSLDDLVQQGTIGLIRAVDLYDPARGYRLSTYATMWIHRYLTVALADAEGFPRQERAHAYEVRSRLSAGDSVRQIARSMKMPEEKAAALARWNITSFDDTPEGSTEPLRDSIPDPCCLEDQATTRVDVNRAMACLKPREREVVRRFYGLTGGEETQQDIAESLGTNQMAVSRILRSSLQKLREQMREGHVCQTELFSDYEDALPDGNGSSLRSYRRSRGSIVPIESPALFQEAA